MFMVYVASFNFFTSSVFLTEEHCENQANVKKFQLLEKVDF